MDEIVVPVARLLATLNKNMTTHEADFELAWDGYAKKVIENAEVLLARAKAVRKGEPLRLYVDLTAPENHIDDYRRAVEIMEWHQEATITLTEREFAEFVQDDKASSRCRTRCIPGRRRLARRGAAARRERDDD